VPARMADRRHDDRSALADQRNHGAEQLPSATPVVMMAEFAIWPSVRSFTTEYAWNTSAAVWVAPNFLALSLFISTGSTATIQRAPAILAPCTAFEPIPPTPTTTTTSRA